jgi:hypothetical protein
MRLFRLIQTLAAWLGQGRYPGPQRFQPNGQQFIGKMPDGFQLPRLICFRQSLVSRDGLPQRMLNVLHLRLVREPAAANRVGSDMLREVKTSLYPTPPSGQKIRITRYRFVKNDIWYESCIWSFTSAPQSNLSPNRN